MTEFNRYAMMMEALTELKPEIEATRQLKRAPVMPPLDEVMAEFGPMPPEALFLGVASDGLPLLLNLHDPIPGPILIAGDSGTARRHSANYRGCSGKIYQRRTHSAH